MLLFVTNFTTGVELAGIRSVDGFCDFVLNYTDFKAKRSSRVSWTPSRQHLRPITENKCLFNAFYGPSRGHSKRCLARARLAALSVQPGLDISLGLSYCDHDHELCQEFIHRVRIFHRGSHIAVKLFKNGVIHA
jgi:hypothetical protein